MTTIAVESADRRLMEGSEAIALASIAAGCRFFAGYPMTPFTEILEHFARKLPEVGGVCINAESELEVADRVLDEAGADQPSEVVVSP